MNSKKQSYDGVARFFDFFAKGDMARWGPSQRSLFKNLRGKVLYIGIGTGQETVNFPEGLDITAVDLSYEMLKRSRQRVAKLSWKNQPLPDGCRDHRVCRQHLRYRSNLLRPLHRETTGTLSGRTQASAETRR